MTVQMKVEEKLRKAIAELSIRNVERISVSALCEKAGISRASFYLYYKDLDDFISKIREYVINKLDEQLNIILDIKDGIFANEYCILLDETDIVLLKGVTGKHVYWDFAIDANKIIIPRCEKKMRERWGDEYYEQNKEKFEFMISGGIFTLYIDLVCFDKETYKKNMHRVTEIAEELFGRK